MFDHLYNFLFLLCDKRLCNLIDQTYIILINNIISKLYWTCRKETVIIKIWGSKEKLRHNLYLITGNDWIITTGFRFTSYTKWKTNNLEHNDTSYLLCWVNFGSGWFCPEPSSHLSVFALILVPSGWFCTYSSSHWVVSPIFLL